MVRVSPVAVSRPAGADLAPLLGDRPLAALGDGLGTMPVQRVAAGKPVVRPHQPVLATPARPVDATVKSVQRRVDDSRRSPSPVAPVKVAEAKASPVEERRPGPDLDDLARRLIEPVGRLLRAELRHGRERAGRLHDRRR